MAKDHTEIKMKIKLAAKKVFALYGYDGASIKRIGQEADINSALISYYFGGKEPLFLEIIQDGFQHSVWEEPSLYDIRSEVRNFIKRVIRFRRKDPDFFSMLNQEMNMQSARKEKIVKLILVMWERLFILLEAGKSQGIFEFKSSRYTVLMIMGVTLFTENICLMDAMHMNDVSEELKEKAMIDFILSGIEARASN